MKKIILLIIEKIRKALKVDEKGNSFYWGKGMLLLTALMMVECGKYEGKNQKGIALAGYSDVEIDSCQYIIGYNVLAHKGNCHFCKERRQKELEELVIKLKEK